ncbi:hypothetical protein EXIGLDRAFT_722404 [Exidia glandulosa HHB12029]|uniref:Uncharacterized protein n=1 Tax=Exidia glandulosa HHB12029 TaxID=1314781 RepID=A0A165FC63_EXIGL|nr:hypothetical protein EXIGLDRAFT_722404 [Exidia glandulosa HHB12029]
MSPALRSELGVAKDIRDMIDSLKRIEHDWAQRTIAAMLADQPETNAWLVGVTNDGEMEPPQDMDVDTEVDPEDDALVRPEDAIEHRFERDADSSIEDVGVHAHSVSRTQDETREASGAAAVSIAGTLPPAAPHEALRDSQSVAERSRAANAAKPKAPVASEPIPHPQQKSSSPSSTMPRKPRGAAVLAKLRAFPRSLVARLWGKVTGPPECLAMVVLENPTETENPIDDGTIVVLRVDPVASVSQIDDEQVRREVAVLKPCKALAFYTSGFGFDVSDRNGDLKVKGLFSLVGRGLPAAPLSCAAIPIAPSPSHPETGRHPVPTSPPFPLPGCYIHTMRQLNAAVRRIHKNAATGYALSAEDFRAARIALFNDAHSFDPPGNKATSEHADSDSQSSNENNNTDDPGPGNAVETADWKDIAPGLSQKDTSPRMTVHVELWLSLTESDELGTPEDVQATVTRLREIEKAWAKRQVVEILANRPATTAWLEGVTPHAEPERPADAAGSTREDDDLVLPEDAIEHRIERGDVPAEGAAATSTVSHGSSSRSPSQSHAAGHLPDAVTPELGASPVSHSRGKEHSAETKKARLSVAGRIRARVVKFVKRFQVKLGAKSA